MGEVREYRLKIGEEVLLKMVHDKVFPLSCRDEVTETMMRYFYEMGYEDQLVHDGYNWLPNKEYWMSNLGALQEILRKKNVYLEGEIFKGNWEVCDRRKFDKRMEVNDAALNSRIESRNGKVTDGNNRWETFNRPLAEPVPLLPS